MKLQFLAAKFGTIVPKRIAHSIYSIVYKLIEKYFKINKMEISPRNSLVTNQINFGTSDIDLNLWIDQNWSLKKFLSCEQKIKKLLPLIGEFNILDFSSAKLMIHFINPYLLEKDPLLIKRLNLTKRDGTKVEKFSYLLHCYAVNKEHIDKFSEQSKRKWRYYFNQTGIVFKGKICRLNILKHISLLVPEFDLNYLDISNLDTDQEINQFYQTKKYRFEMMCLTPTIWLGAATLYNSISKDIEDFALDDGRLQVMVEGLKWELWGIYTQRYFIPKEGVVDHLLKVKNVFEIINQSGHNNEVSCLLVGINELMEIINNEL